jgi:APA family basic amino acid/polyamine antiporter
MSKTQKAAGQPSASPAGDAKAAGGEFVIRFGLPTATALVVGSVIGTGVFAASQPAGDPGVQS